MEIKTQNLQFVVASVETATQPVLIAPRPLPAVVALARVIMRPVQSYEVLKLPTPKRFALVRYTPWGAKDPILPVPLVDFGSVFFDELGRVGEHLDRWRREDSAERQRDWSKTGYALLTDFTTWLDGNFTQIGMLIDEKSWFVIILWRLWADPSAGEILGEVRVFSDRVDQMRSFQQRFERRNRYLLGE